MRVIEKCLLPLTALAGDERYLPPLTSLQVDAYFPAGTWHSIWDNTSVDAGNTGCIKTLHAPLGDVPVHVRGGSVVPMQQAALVTEDVRSSPLTLLIALPHKVGGARLVLGLRIYCLFALWRVASHRERDKIASLRRDGCGSLDGKR